MNKQSTNQQNATSNASPKKDTKGYENKDPTINNISNSRDKREQSPSVSGKSHFNK